MEKIKSKAEYCLNCISKPCQKGCPLGNDIPAFISYIKEEKFEDAYQVLTKSTVLSPICGLICPHNSQCEGSCIRRFKGKPTSIGELEAYVGKVALENNYPFKKEKIEKKNKKVAVIGGGPAGLTCSAFLALGGYDVTIYEKHENCGGILAYGIPEFRLPRDILEKTINKITSIPGIKVKTNKELGKDFNLQELSNNYDAVFLAIGSNISSKMNIEGEELEGVYGANELLENKVFPDFKDKKVAVIGGGNVAMDAARTIKRSGAKETYIIYRRAEEQMPAEKKEIEEAKEEKIEFLFQNNIVKIIPKNNEKRVGKIECIKTELIQKEKGKRPSPVDVEGSNYLLDMDYVIMAIGSKTEENILKEQGIELNEKGYIKVDESYKTNIENVYAGGDVIGTKATVAWAAKIGRNVAEVIKDI